MSINDPLLVKVRERRKGGGTLLGAYQQFKATEFAHNLEIDGLEMEGARLYRWIEVYRNICDKSQKKSGGSIFYKELLLDMALAIRILSHQYREI